MRWRMRHPINKYFSFLVSLHGYSFFASTSSHPCELNRYFLREKKEVNLTIKDYPTNRKMVINVALRMKGI